MTRDSEPSNLVKRIVQTGVVTLFLATEALICEYKYQKLSLDYHLTQQKPSSSPITQTIFYSGLGLIAFGMIALYRHDKPTIYSPIDTSISAEKSSFTLSDWFNSAENRARIAKEKAQVQAQTSKQKQ